MVSAEWNRWEDAPDRGGQQQVFDTMRTVERATAKTSVVDRVERERAL